MHVRDITEAELKEDNAKKQGRMEEEDNQLYRRPQMTGQAREEEIHSVKPGVREILTGQL